MPAEEDDAPTLLMAQVNAVVAEPERVGGHILLNEERARVCLGDKSEPVDVPWYLDTGASNHMTGDRSVFADLDENIAGTVRFGDNSIIDIRGHGIVMFAMRGDEHRALTDVYYIPHRKTSIVRLG